MKEHKDKAKFFDRHSREWAKLGFDQRAKRKVRWILKRSGIHRGMTILEPGCGTGRLTPWLSQMVGPTGRIIANDISAKMLQKARQVAMNPNVTFLLSSAERLKLRRKSVDLILCFNVFPHFHDKPGALKRFEKLLNRDGKLVVAHLMGSKKVNEIHRSTGGAVKHDMVPDAQQMELMFRSAGFRIDELIDEEERYFLTARHTIPRPRRRTRPLALGVVASPRAGGNTDILVERVLEGARMAGMHTEKMLLDELNIAPCRSCFTCFQTGRCIQKDGMQKIYRLLPKASLLVFGSPIYLNYLSAQAKLFIDRLYPYIVKNPKRVSLEGLKCVLVLTQGNPDPRKYRDVEKHVRRCLSHFFGIHTEKLIRQCGNFHRVTVLSDRRLLRRAMQAPQALNG